MSSVNQISVFVENRPGTLNAMTKILADANIDLRAFSLAETTDFGIARMIVDDVYDAQNVLKDNGYVSSLTPVLAVKVPDVPGGLNSVLSGFTENDINVEYMYGFRGKDPKSAYMIFRISDVKAGAAALKSKGVKVLQEEELI